MNRKSARTAALKQVLSDPRATPADRVKAAALLDKIAVRRDTKRRRKAAAAAELEVLKPAPTCSPEEWAEVEAELARRDAAHLESQRVAIGARKAYFDAHPDRAAEVIRAIGEKEFLRITTIPE